MSDPISLFASVYPSKDPDTVMTEHIGSWLHKVLSRSSAIAVDGKLRLHEGDRRTIALRALGDPLQAPMTTLANLRFQHVDIPGTSPESRRPFVSRVALPGFAPHFAIQVIRTLSVGDGAAATDKSGRRRSLRAMLQPWRHQLDEAGRHLNESGVSGNSSDRHLAEDTTYLPLYLRMRIGLDTFDDFLYGHYSEDLPDDAMACFLDDKAVVEGGAQQFDYMWKEAWTSTISQLQDRDRRRASALNQSTAGRDSEPFARSGPPSMPPSYGKSDHWTHSQWAKPAASFSTKRKRRRRLQQSAEVYLTQEVSLPNITAQVDQVVDEVLQQHLDEAQDNLSDIFEALLNGEIDILFPTTATPAGARPPHEALTLLTSLGSLSARYVVSGSEADAGTLLASSCGMQFKGQHVAESQREEMLCNRAAETMEDLLRCNSQGQCQDASLCPNSTDSSNSRCKPMRLPLPTSAPLKCMHSDCPLVRQSCRAFGAVTGGLDSPAEWVSKNVPPMGTCSTHLR